jgi:F5/8 type C domain/Secretion system C-terminal sorting domain
MRLLILLNVLCLSVLTSIDALSQPTDVLTQHNDLARSGWNNTETILDTSNVNHNTFGLVASRFVDDQIYAQPLVATGLNMGNGTKNVVFVCTVNNTVYAFDADDTSSSATYYWTHNFTPPNSRPPNKVDIHPGLCGGSYSDYQPTYNGLDTTQFFGNFGIVGTPVIDKSRKLMYLVTRYVDRSVNVDQGPHTGTDCRNGATVDFDTAYSSAGFHMQFRCISILTGRDTLGSPVMILASASGTGGGSHGGVIDFDARRNQQRGGLALSNGIVYVPFAAHCDWDNSHGWLLGFDASTLALRLTFITTPNDARGGIWMSGGGPAVDASGNIYFTTGNARVGDRTAACSPALDQDYDYTNPAYSPGVPQNRGESVIKLQPNLGSNTFTIADYFGPTNFQYLNDADLDFPTQVMLIPSTNLLVTGCKDNNLYLFPTDNLGQYSSSGNNPVVQLYNVGSNAFMHSSLAYFGGSTTQYLYQWAENTNLQAFPVFSSALGSPVVSGINNGPTQGTGAFMSVSSHGSDPATGILWVTQAINGCNANNGQCPGELRAIKASNVNQELWNSNTDFQDNYSLFAKMSCPTVANGKVYVPTHGNQLAIYGLKPSNPCANNIALGKTVTASTINSPNVPAYAVDGITTTFWGSLFTDNQWLVVDLGSAYNICGVSIDWQPGSGASTFGIDVSSDGVNWTNIDSVTSNAASLNSVNGAWSDRYVRISASLRQNPGGGYAVLEMDVFGTPLGSCTAPTLLAPSPVDPNDETISWNPVTGATGYNIEYKVPIVANWLDTSSTSTTFTARALSCNSTTYDYQVQTVCGANTSPFAPGNFLTQFCSGSCGQLPTRYYHADLGDIGVAGNSCLNVNTGVYTISGSGIGLKGGVDGFQYAFTNYSGDEQTGAEVLSQDAVETYNKAGVMMRDSLSITSRFIFLGLESGNGDGVVVVYRSTPGGPTDSITLSGYPAPYYVRLSKTGTMFSAYISPDGNTWTQVGSALNLNFGTNPIYTGMAVTSSYNSVLSTATFTFFPPSQPLPIKLVSFTASNINNEFVYLQWATSMELNSSYFDVERSTDGVTFQKITSVKAIGNSDVMQNYSAQDPNPAEGINYYRLKEVDLDNNVTYSQVRPVRFGKQPDPIIYPNPSTSYFDVIAGSETVSEITLFNVSGKTLLSVQNQSGSSTISISTADLAPGVYIVQIKTASRVYEQKLLRE